MPTTSGLKATSRGGRRAGGLSINYLQKKIPKSSCLVRIMMVVVVMMTPRRVWEAGERVESCKKMDNLRVQGGFDSA